MTMHCIEGIVEATSTGTREGSGPTIRRELVRVRDATGKEIRVVNILLTGAMDTYLGTVTAAHAPAKFFVARHEDHTKKEANILFAIRSNKVDYCEADFWDAEKVVAIKATSKYTYISYVLALVVAFCLFRSMVAGILAAIVIVPILVGLKMRIAPVNRRLAKMNTAAEMRGFIAEADMDRQLMAS
jgi:hypothetical protein